MAAITTTSKPKSTKTTTASKATATSKVTSSATHSSTQHVSSSSSASTSTISSSGTLGPSPSAQPESTNADKSGLSTPAIAGIAAAGGLIVLFILSIFICKKRRAHQYAKRDFGYDPNRDPIDPNDMFSPDNKYDQSNSSPHSRPPPPHNGSEFVTYPLAVLGADQQRDTKPRLADSDQDPRNQYEHQHHGDHIQSHFNPESPDLRTHPVVGTPNSRAPTLPPLSTTQSSSNTGSSPPMSPSQRAKLNNQRQNNSQGSNSPRSPRSHLQQHPLDSRSEPESFVVNDMGNQFVLQNGNTSPSRQVMDRGRGGVDQEGSLRQPDISYRQLPMMNQESSVIGMGSQNPSPQPGPYYRPPGSPSIQQRNVGTGPNNIGGSPYSSPRNGPMHYSSGSPLMQYQYPPQVGPMYSPQQRPPYPGGGPVRSPPLGAQRGPGYAQANPNYRPYTNY
ncbi:hypothetical protein BGZ79_005623 [Entomortierella chlamydospora]|nr:hypothetical protein BGZ79_005623 [Entomortierella chlamydospora]